jgi:RP/EB family microtubule-associated protein
MATATTARRVAPQGNSPPQTPSSVGHLQQTINTLTKQLTEMRLTTDEMEKERDFYFTKLRDIEMATQHVTDPTLLNSDLFKQITEILYKTEDGFEIPQESSS